MKNIKRIAQSQTTKSNAESGSDPIPTITRKTTGVVYQSGAAAANDNDYLILTSKIDSMDRKLATLVQAKNSLDTNRLWSYSDIADYLNCSVSSVRGFAKHSNFPLACKPDVDDLGRRLQPRYVPSEIIDWVTRHREYRVS